jgi:hypothetical protein
MSGEKAGNSLLQTLIARSGLTLDIMAYGQDNPVFAEILKAMGLIHTGKQVLYGDYLQTHGSDPLLFALMEHFCDVKRKYVRAEHFVKKASEGTLLDLDELLDTYCDLAVYGAIGVQLVNHLKRREELNATGTDRGSNQKSQPEWPDGLDDDVGSRSPNDGEC